MRDRIKLILGVLILFFLSYTVYAAFIVSDQTPKEFTSINAKCDFTVPETPSAAILIEPAVLIEDGIESIECSLINWIGNTGNFTCDTGVTGNKTARCTINKSRAYQVGEDILLNMFICASNTWDIDGLVETGCEYTCDVTNNGIEICDGLDNDCNGEIDDTFINEDCSFLCELNGFTWTGNLDNLNCCGNDPLEARPYEELTEITCTDENDNDCDGLEDWNDPDCSSLCDNIGENNKFIAGIIGDCDQCNHEGDDDNDQLDISSNVADRCDSDCVGTGYLPVYVKGETITSEKYEETELTCDDNLDNDCDGYLDCEDSDCVDKIGPNAIECCQSEETCDGVDACHSCIEHQCNYQIGEQIGCDFCAKCDETENGECIGDLTQDTGETGNDCNANDLIAINQCDYTPDTKSNTRDEHAAVYSTCSAIDTCTTPSYTSWTHTCDLTCGAECEEGDTREVETYYCSGQIIMKQKDGCNTDTCLFQDDLEPDITITICIGGREDNMCVNGQSICNQCGLEGDQDGDGIIDVNDAHCGGKDESCNNIDDDGDGIKDDDYISLSCGQGDCSGMTVCVNSNVECQDTGIIQANTDCGTCCKCSSDLVNPVETYDSSQDTGLVLGDCDSFDLLAVSTCDNTPDDNIHSTYDTHEAIFSQCSATKTCTTPSYGDVVNTCNKATCNAQCESGETQAQGTYYCNVNDIMEHVKNCDISDCLFKDQTTDDDLLKTTCLGTGENNICYNGQGPTDCNQCDLAGDQDNDQLGWSSIDADRCDSDCGTVAVTVQQPDYYAENTQAACTDNIDNDCDGDVDIYDDDCSFNLVITPNPIEPNNQVTFSLAEDYYTSGIVDIYTEPCPGVNLQCSFDLSLQNSCSIISSSTPDIYTYYACAGTETNEDDEELTVQAQGHCSTQETHSEGDDFTPAQYLHEYIEPNWVIYDCNYLYDTKYCHCAISNQNLNHVCDDYQCQGEAGLAACIDSGNDWQFESWLCDETSVYCSLDQDCEEDSYYCYRTNENTFTWKKVTDFINGETNCNDGYDNDCDNTFDNNQGINSDSDCCSYSEPIETLCDGIDSNCDGRADDNFAGDDCQERCTALTYVWKGNSGDANCCGDDTWEITTGEDQNIETDCDGLDNDCDGIIDEGCCECSGTSCNPSYNGQICDGCDYITAPIEVCDGIDNDCDGIIDDGICSNGESCASNMECLSGYCVDGVCCDNACTGTCKACDVSGNVGICTNVPSGQDIDNECPGGFGICAGSSCNGAGACQYLTGQQNCGACKYCSGSSYSCSNVADGQDTYNDCNIDCTQYIYGWDGNNCKAFASNSYGNGMCNGAGSCRNIGTDCSGDNMGLTISSCGNGCKKSDACVQYSDKASYDETSEVCYTSTQHDCPAGEECSSTGVCQQPCDGWLYNGDCWYEFSGTTSCTEGCASHGGSVGCRNDWTDCRVCKHFHPEEWYGCDEWAAASGIPCWDYNTCAYQELAYECTNWDPDKGNDQPDWWRKFCVCQY